MSEKHVSYMTKEQLEAYLKDLRSNRPARPIGSRPPPPSAYQQKRAAAAAAAAASASAATAESQATPSTNGELIRRDSSHRRSKTTPASGFSRRTMEYPPEPAQHAVLGIEDDVSELSLETPPQAQYHSRSKSAQGWEGNYNGDRHNPHQNHPLPARQRERIDAELHEHFQNMPPPVAPLKVTKLNGGTVGVSPSSSSASRRSERAPQVANPSRYVYNEPNQFHRVKYTTNPIPLPSPPPEVISDDERRPKDIGTREDRGRPPLPTIKIKKQPPEPPVIAVMEAPASPPQSTRDITPPSSAVPRIAVSSSDPLPVIRTPDDHTNGGSSIPIMSVTSSEPAATTQTRRPLPVPNGKPNPFRKHTTRSNSVYSNASGTGRPGATCTLCGDSIAGRIVSALGSRFHPECFTCFHCGERLEHVGFFPEPEKNRQVRAEVERCRVDELDKRFYCHLDFHELFSPRCKNCKTPIEGEVVVACGETWHVGHFFCAECGDPFTSKTRFVEKDKYAWCLGCYEKRYSSKCKKCKKPVTDTVVRALGAEWHVECFVCAIGHKAKKAFSYSSSSRAAAAAGTSSGTTGTGSDAAKVVRPAAATDGTTITRKSSVSFAASRVIKPTLKRVRRVRSSLFGYKDTAAGTDSTGDATPAANTAPTADATIAPPIKAPDAAPAVVARKGVDSGYGEKGTSLSFASGFQANHGPNAKPNANASEGQSSVTTNANIHTVQGSFTAFSPSNSADVPHQKKKHHLHNPLHPHNPQPRPASSGVYGSAPVSILRRIKSSTIGLRTSFISSASRTPSISSAAGTSELPRSKSPLPRLLHLPSLKMTILEAPEPQPEPLSKSHDIGIPPADVVRSLLSMRDGKVVGRNL